MISEGCPLVDPAGSVTVDAIVWDVPVMEVLRDELDECESQRLAVDVELVAVGEALPLIEADLALDSPDYEIISTTDGIIARNEQELHDLAPYVDKYRDQYDLDDMPQAVWDAATVGGRILGVPLSAAAPHFFYNAEILAEHGITPPDNYDELLVACETLRAAGFADPFNVNLDSAGVRALEFDNILKSLGGTLINDDNTPGWNNAAGLEAANTLLAVSETCMSDAGRGFSIDDAEAALRSGTLPMAMTWSDRAAAMDDPAISDVVGKIEFAPALRTHAGSARNAPTLTLFLSIPEGVTVDPELVFLVIMAGTDLESQSAAAAHVAMARLSAAHADAPRNSAAVAQSVAEGVGPRSGNPALSIARVLLGEAVWAIIQDGADPAAELAEAEAAYIEQATAAGYL